MLLRCANSALVHGCASYRQCCEWACHRCHWLVPGRHPCPSPPFLTRYLQWRNSPLPLPETKTAQHDGSINPAPCRSHVVHNAESATLRGQSQNGQDISMSTSRRSSPLAQLKKILSLSYLLRVRNGRPVLSPLHYPHQRKMGSASPVTPFVPLGETPLFKPLDLGKWHLQHRIVQVSAP